MLPQPRRNNSQKNRVSRDNVWPAPVEGGDASTALASMDEKRAVSLINWFPQPGYVEIRKGSERWCSGIGSDLTVVTVDDANDRLLASPNPFNDDDAIAVVVSDGSGSTTEGFFYVINSLPDGFQITQDEPDEVQTPFPLNPITGDAVAYRIGVWNSDFGRVVPAGSQVETLIPYEIPNIQSS